MELEQDITAIIHIPAVAEDKLVILVRVGEVIQAGVAIETSIQVNQGDNKSQTQPLETEVNISAPVNKV